MVTRGPFLSTMIWSLIYRKVVVKATIVEIVKSNLLSFTKRNTNVVPVKQSSTG